MSEELAEEVYLSTHEAGAQWSIALGNQMGIDWLRDKIMKITDIIMGNLQLYYYDYTGDALPVYPFPFSSHNWYCLNFVFI